MDKLLPESLDMFQIQTQNLGGNGLLRVSRFQQGRSPAPISIAMAPVSAAEKAALDGFFKGRREQPTHGGRVRMLA